MNENNCACCGCLITEDNYCTQDTGCSYDNDNKEIKTYSKDEEFLKRFFDGKESIKTCGNNRRYEIRNAGVVCYVDPTSVTSIKNTSISGFDNIEFTLKNGLRIKFYNSKYSNHILKNIFNYFNKKLGSYGC